MATEPDSQLRKLLEAGAEIAGGTVGGALGLLEGTQGLILGAAGGVLVSRSLMHVASEIAGREFSPREAARVGAVLNLTARAIAERLSAGDQLRDDGFFAPRGFTRPAAHEAAEHIALRAKSEFEEAKLPFLANLLASIAFDKSTSLNTAHLLVRTISRISYRQLCLVRLAAIPEVYPLSSTDFAQENDANTVPRDTHEITWELMDLQAANLVRFDYVAMAPGNIRPATIQLLDLGHQLHHMSRLDTIESSEIDLVALPLCWSKDR